LPSPGSDSSRCGTALTPRPLKRPAAAARLTG
jgi:hypothetical protein